MSGSGPGSASRTRVLGPRKAASAGGSSTVAERPTRRRAGARVCRRARQSASWSPRLLSARAWISSTMTRERAAKIAGASWVGEHQGEGFGGGEQDVRRVDALAGAGGGLGVAGAVLDADGEGHLGEGGAEVAADVGGERLQRGDVEGVQAGGRGGAELDEGGEEAGEGLAAAGRGDEEGGGVGGAVEEGELVGVRGPAAAGEPAGEGLGEGGSGRHDRLRWGGGGAVQGGVARDNTRAIPGKVSEGEWDS